MKAIILGAVERFFSPLLWSYRPESMRPSMRRRNFFGFKQCQIKQAGKWVKAPHAASRYQWKPVQRKAPAVAVAE